MRRHHGYFLNFDQTSDARDLDTFFSNTHYDICHDPKPEVATWHTFCTQVKVQCKKHAAVIVFYLSFILFFTLFCVVVSYYVFYFFLQLFYLVRSFCHVVLFSSSSSCHHSHIQISFRSIGLITSLETSVNNFESLCVNDDSCAAACAAPCCPT